MFDKEVDAAQIMENIKQSIIPQEEKELYLKKLYDNSFDELKRKIVTLHAHIGGLKEHAAPYLETGYFVPSFDRFPWIIKKLLRVVTKIVNRLTKPITREQNLVNHDLQSSIDALLQCQIDIQKELESIHKQIESLSDRPKEEIQ